MEVLPNIHRIEAPLGDRFVCLFLITGSRGALVLDTGMDDMPRQYLAPYLAQIGLAPSDIRYVLLSHADVDHTGGNQSLREMAPQAIFMCHTLDRPMVEDLELMISGRYSQYAADHGLDDSDETRAWMRANARHCAIDVGLSGGETIWLDDDWPVEVLFTPGHTRGHITLYAPHQRCAIIADAALWSSIVSSTGEPMFPPTYRYVESYVNSIHRLQSLPFETLLTSHYPVYQGEAAAAFLSESRAYVDRVEEALVGLLRQAAAPLTLQEIIGALKIKLGPWPGGNEMLLDFPLSGHLERLLAYGQVTTGRRDGLLTYICVAA